MKSKSKTKNSNNFRKKSLKRKKKTRRHAQNGGEIVAFQLYFFTEHEITEPTKTQLMAMLIELYGSNISYTDDSELQVIGKLFITKLVHKKKDKKYINKKQTLGFSVNTFPEELKGDMNDDKLTHEENKIQMALVNKKLPFRLVDTPPGLWSPELAIIAFENKNS